jgi:small-conductance mechanosensitive channel
LATSRKQLDAAKEGHAQTQNDTVHSAADFRLELQQVQAENADFNFKTLNILNEILKLRQGLHEFRWSLADSKDAEKIRLAYGRISQAESQISPVKGYVLQQLKLADNTISDLEKRLILAGSPQERANFQQLIELYNQRRTTIHRVLSGFDRTEQLLEFFKQDLDDRHATESLSERINNRLVQLKNLSAQIWQFELFAVEDSIEIDGKAITGKRSVTVGKVSTALMILIIGFWIVIQLSQRVERMAVNRVGMDASHARIARRWLLLILGMILVVISLEMVRIPLTVFAFMGGVLAIGSGFAMQNLLKNLISGLMLLMERPFRPGDLVEVGGIRGRVIDIGMRSSQIRDGNGIETVIPNSTFVETNVTNWTLSSKSVRIVIKIGVDYAAPVNELTDLLIEIAHRHGMVQDKPPPQVMFEDFGSDALLFGLYVWVELNNDLDWRVVASDLRYMINKTLAAHNIVIAYPQRDIHLDTRRPLEVKVIADSSDVATTELNGHAFP